MLVILALVASLVGIAGIGYSIYAFKFLGVDRILLLPSRVFFVFSLGLAVVPFLLVIFVERMPYLLLVVPTVLCFLLYPILEPHGVIYGQDALFNFQFALSFLQHSVWVAGANTSDQAVTYSYYPGSGLFNAEGSVFLGIPLTSSFPWVLPTMRLLVLPPLIYVIGSRVLSPRAGVLGIFFYLAAPSITLNDLVFQEFTLPFFVLTLTALTLLVSTPSEHATPLRILVLVFSSFVILSHHLTSYILGVWLAGLAVLPLLFWGRPVYLALRSAAVALRYFALFLVYVFFFTAAIVLRQLTSLETSILLILSNAPISPRTAATGNSYPTYQLVWIVASLGILVLFTIFTMRVALRGSSRQYLSASLVVTTIILIAAFILFATPYSFVAIRASEYALVFAAPAAAWFLLRRFIPAVDRRVRGREAAAFGLRRGTSARWVAPAVAILLAFFVFTGGNLVPGLSRDQFQPHNLLLVNSPMHLTAADFQDGLWARSHLTLPGRVWGDMLVYDVYAGIGGLTVPFGAYNPFNGTTLTPQNFVNVKVGDYFVTDVYDTALTPTFYGKTTLQPTAPLAEAQLTKFNNLAYFSVVFSDSVFTVYLDTQLCVVVSPTVPTLTSTCP